MSSHSQDPLHTLPSLLFTPFSRFRVLCSWLSKRGIGTPVLSITYTAAKNLAIRGAASTPRLYPRAASTSTVQGVFHLNWNNLWCRKFTWSQPADGRMKIKKKYNKRESVQEAWRKKKQNISRNLLTWVKFLKHCLEIALVQEIPLAKNHFTRRGVSYGIDRKVWTAKSRNKDDQTYKVLSVRPFFAWRFLKPVYCT